MKNPWPILVIIAAVALVIIGGYYGYKEHLMLRDRSEYSTLNEDANKLITLAISNESVQSGITKSKAQWDTYYASNIAQIQTAINKIEADKTDTQELITYQGDLVSIGQDSMFQSQAQQGAQDMLFKIEDDTALDQSDQGKLTIWQSIVADDRSAGTDASNDETQVTDWQGTLRTDQQTLASDQGTETQSKQDASSTTKILADIQKAGTKKEELAANLK